MYWQKCKQALLCWRPAHMLVWIGLSVLINPAFFNAALASQAVNSTSKTVQLALTTEPPDLNSLTSTDSVSFFVQLHTQEGLLTYGDADSLTAGVAESWQMDGTSVRFTLRKNARWCDGKPVTAQDFVFAWRTALDPKTASRYGFILYPIKNAEKIHGGSLPLSALAVYADDDYNLRIELEKPTAYFLSLTTFPTYFPIREDFYRAQGSRYAAEANTLLCNGAFRLSEWTHGASLTLEKNPQYWQANNVHINTIRIPHISNDPNTLFNLFQANDIALAELSNETVQQALQQRLFIQSFANGMLTYLEFNQRADKPLANSALRHAIAASIDCQQLVNKIIASPGTKPATRFFPQWFNQLAFTADPTENNKKNNTAAATYTIMQPLTLLVYDSPAVIRQAEYLQKILKQTLGLQIVIDRQIFKQKLAKLAADDFDLALSAWGPDYNDPMTFADLLHSANENNHGAYHNPAYDALLTQAAALPDSPQRNALFTAMSNMIEHDAAVLPLTEPGIIYVQNKQLDKVSRRRFGGDPDLRFARIIEGTP
jgi:oligopeptide transport system substrate-binding protein